MKTTVPCFSVASATAVRLVVGAALAAPLTMIAPTDGATRTATAQEWTTLRVAAYDLPGLTETGIKGHETDDGYASCVVPDGEYSGTALVLRDGDVVYRQPLMGPLPMAFQGQPEDEARCYPIEDLTGNGHGNVHIQDMTSRSTTLHVILDLGPDGVSEIFNETLHFTENLAWEDTDGDGVLEPTVSGKEGLDHIRPGRPGVMPPQELDAPVTRSLTIE